MPQPNDPHSNDLNPYAAPADTNSAQSSFPSAAARVRGPALSLMICAGIFLGLLVLGFLFNIFLIFSGLTSDNGGPTSSFTTVVARTVFGCLLMLINGFIFYGALQMQQLSSLTAARTAAILACVPCVGPCYFLGIPFGIWALVALNDPQVRGAFRN